MRFSLGFMKPSPEWPFGSEASFGAPGAGGSLGFADPKAGIGYAYVTSQMGTSLTGDPRDTRATKRAVLNHSTGIIGREFHTMTRAPRDESGSGWSLREIQNVPVYLPWRCDLG